MSSFHKVCPHSTSVCLSPRQSIALGALSIPSVFATLGLVPGVILVGKTVLFGSQQSPSAHPPLSLSLSDLPFFLLLSQLESVY